MEPHLPGPSREIPPFTVADVLVDAWRSFRRRLGVHLGSNAVFLALAMMAFCGISCLIVPVMAAVGIAAGASGSNAPPTGPAVGMLLAIYALLLVAMFFLSALHQAFTLAVTDADLRGGPADFSSAFRATGPRLAAVAGAMAIRWGLYLLVGTIVFAVVGALVIASSGTSFAELASSKPASGMPSVVVAAIGIAYLIFLGCIFALHAFVGLSGPCARNEELGPRRAIARSVRLLEGRRLQFVGVRLAWAMIAVVLVLVSEAPMLFFFLGKPPDEQAAYILAFAPYMLFFYYFQMVVFSFDSVLDGAYFARVVPRDVSVGEVAHVFA